METTDYQKPSASMEKKSKRPRKRKAESRTFSKNKKLKLNSQESTAESDLSQFDKLTLDDIICPICLSILVEPVTLPCQHTLCHQCFDDNVTHTAYTCPLCRKRIGVWRRKAAKAGSLVNLNLWRWIQEHFKDKLEARELGKDDSKIYQEVPKLPISAPGEIAEDFEKEQEKLLKELQRHHEKEEKESELELKRIEEETQRKKEALRILCKEDEDLAKKYREELFRERKAEILGQSPNVGSKKMSKLNTLDTYLGQYNTQSVSISRSEINSGHECTNHLISENDIKKESLPSAVNQMPMVFFPLGDITHSNSESEAESQELGNTGSKKTPIKNRVGKENKVIVKTEFSPHQIFTNENKISLKPLPTKVNEQGSTIIDSVASTSNDGEKGMLSLLTTFDFEPCAESFAIEGMDPESLANFIEEQKAEEKRLEQVRDDQKYAQQMQKNMGKIDRSKGSEAEYGLRKKADMSSSSIMTLMNSPVVQSKQHSRKIVKVNKTPKSKIRLNAESPTIRQTTIMETLSKRRLSEEY